MIFASLGTMDMPFVRMAKAVDGYAMGTDEEVVVQSGYTEYPYKKAKHFDFCTKDEMRAYMSKADVLVLQGGWGAISEAMEEHKRIVVMPRKNGLEHIHDQFQLVRKLDSLGCVVGVFEESDLPKAIEKARKFNFSSLPRGRAADIIEEKLREWFGHCNLD